MSAIICAWSCIRKTSLGSLRNFKIQVFFQRILVFSFDTLYLILMYRQVSDLDSDDYFLVKVNRIPPGTMLVAAISICQVLQMLLNS